MRDLKRNQSPVFFRTYLGREEIIDQYGNKTGSYIPIYSDLQSAMLCVSPNKGSSEVEQYGTTLQYDRIMTTADTSCGINEQSVLWVDGADTSEAWNYVVKAKSLWFNSVQYAIQKVDVSVYDAYQEQISQSNNTH